MSDNTKHPAPARWRRIGALLTISALLVGGGCTPTTQVVESYKDPSVTGPLKFKKILVLVVHPDAHTRRTAEDELVRQIGADRAMPSDRILTDADRGDVQKIKAKVKESGVDGVVTMRVAGATSSTGYAPRLDPYSYDSLWHDYDRTVMAPGAAGGAMYAERTISIRTKIFSVADEKAVWTGVSESFDPVNTRSLIGEIAKAVVKRLREEGLIA